VGELGSYVDVTADLQLITRIEAPDATARGRGTTAVLSVGLAPGLTNLLAAAAAAQLDTVRAVDLVVQLGLGDVHGPAAVAWLLEQITPHRHRPAPTGDAVAAPFAHRRRFIQPDRRRALAAYTFPFPEQHTLRRTLGLPVTTWLALSRAPAADRSPRHPDRPSTGCCTGAAPLNWPPGRSPGTACRNGPSHGRPPDTLHKRSSAGRHRGQLRSVARRAPKPSRAVPVAASSARRIRRRVRTARMRARSSYEQASQRQDRADEASSTNAGMPTPNR
jgi:hypothetical protein